MKAPFRDVCWIRGFWVFDWYKHSPFTVLRAIRKLTRYADTRVAPTPRSLAKEVVPKHVWIFWLQGWEEAPALVRACRDSWARLNPEWTVHALDKESMQQFMTLDVSMEGKHVDNVAYADFCRVGLLQRYGGVWADATVFCAEPLDAWLPSVTQSGFFAFYKHSSTNGSWFLAGAKGNYLVNAWEAYTRRYWSMVTERGPYFWVHYMFEYLILLDGGARRVWRQTPRISSDGPYEIQNYLRQGNDPDECVRILRESEAVVFKLNWKMPASEQFVRALDTYSGRNQR
jgi:hypothetical protein